jgi:Tn3 transposase DDE domain
VDGWTHFSKAFTHLYIGQPAPDRTGLLTAILADATNLDKTRMADATEKYTPDRLAWIEDWYIREPNYARALATIVNLQGRDRRSGRVFTTYFTARMGAHHHHWHLPLERHGSALGKVPAPPPRSH